MNDEDSSRRNAFGANSRTVNGATRGPEDRQLPIYCFSANEGRLVIVNKRVRARWLARERLNGPGVYQSLANN
jgi:hypothetical protein